MAWRQACRNEKTTTKRVSTTKKRGLTFRLECKLSLPRIQHISIQGYGKTSDAQTITSILTNEISNWKELHNFMQKLKKHWLTRFEETTNNENRKLIVSRKVT